MDALGRAPNLGLNPKKPSIDAFRRALNLGLNPLQPYTFLYDRLFKIKRLSDSKPNFKTGSFQAAAELATLKLDSSVWAARVTVSGSTLGTLNWMMRRGGMMSACLKRKRRTGMPRNNFLRMDLL